jgi:hypothetical protein
MINWKIPAGFAGFAALVSLLAGIIGGNPFGVILLRLFLSAVVGGGVGLGVNLIVNKFLPELSTNPPIPQTESGEEVDIVIDEDIPLAEEAEEQQSSQSAQLLEPAEQIEPAEEVMAAEEKEEEVPMDGGEEDVLALEEVDSEQDTIPEEFVPGIAASQVEDFENLDTLPDIDGFTPTTEDSPPPTKTSRMSSQVEEVVRDQDPENLARAVRTFMKKDQ